MKEPLTLILLRDVFESLWSFQRTFLENVWLKCKILCLYRYFYTLHRLRYKGILGMYRILGKARNRPTFYYTDRLRITLWITFSIDLSLHQSDRLSALYSCIQPTSLPFSKYFDEIWYADVSNRITFSTISHTLKSRLINSGVKRTD